MKVIRLIRSLPTRSGVGMSSSPVPPKKLQIIIQQVYKKSSFRKRFQGENLQDCWIFTRFFKTFCLLYPLLRDRRTFFYVIAKHRYLVRYHSTLQPIIFRVALFTFEYI